MKTIVLLSFITSVFIFQVSAQSSGKPSTEPSVDVSSGNAQVKKETVKLNITGLTCAGCNNHLYKVLSETIGVLNNSVEYPGDLAVIEYDSEKTTVVAIVKTIEEKTPYKAEVYNEKSKAKI